MTPRTALALAALLPALIGPIAATAGDEPGRPPAPAPSPGDGIFELICAIPVTLERPRTWYWSAERPEVTELTVFIAAVEPDLARPRAVGAPTLFAGPAPVERVNAGVPSGVVIGLLPPGVDLRVDPLYFGPAVLPEQIDAEAGAAILADAGAAGVTPRPEAERAYGACGPALEVLDDAALYGALADLTDAHAPGEEARTALWRLNDEAQR